MFERMCASPGMLRATMESNLRIDARPILPTLSAPTLVIHAREAAVPVQNGRYLTDQADAVDSARDGPPRPGHRPQMNSRSQRA